MSKKDPERTPRFLGQQHWLEAVRQETQKRRARFEGTGFVWSL